jgi:hypothetical protein
MQEEEEEDKAFGAKPVHFQLFFLPLQQHHHHHHQLVFEWIQLIANYMVHHVTV